MYYVVPTKLDGMRIRNSRTAKLLLEVLALGILWLPATAGSAKPGGLPSSPKPKLLILPSTWLSQDPFSPIITKLGSPGSLWVEGETMIQFRQFMGGNATIIQLNGLPVGKRFKFANFDRTFKSTRDFEAFIVEHLRNNYATTILDLSERGEFSTKGGDFEGYLRTRRMSELYPEAQFISFGPIALRIEFQERRIVRGKRRGDRTKYQISTNHRDVVAWHHHIHNPVEFSYTYNPVGNVLQEQESDLVNVVPIWLGPATVQEFDSLFIARRTRNGIESPVALDRAIEMLWGGQFRRHGPIPSFEPGNGAVSEKGVISGIDTIHYSFVLPGRRIP